MNTETMMTARTVELDAGIGEQRVRVKIRVGRAGVHLLASLEMGEYLPEGTDPMSRLIDGLYTESRELTWDAIEAAGGPFYRTQDEAVMDNARDLGRVLVRRALPLKPAGVTYCDGTE